MGKNKRKKAEPAPPGRYRPFDGLALGKDEPGDAGTGGPKGRKAGPPEPREPGEEDLFREAVRDVRRIQPGGRIVAGREPRPAPVPDESEEWRKFARDLARGEAAFDVRWSDEYVEGRRAEVDEDTMERLRKGRIAWQEYLDLHGLTRVEAREKVERFVVNARSRGVRCVLVVTGRGKGSEGGIPVLKEKLVAWLARKGGIGSSMLAFSSARPCDGGVGAVYVLLKKPDGTRPGRGRT